MLVPGVPGLSENIRVTAIIDRYLEHSRLVWFQNGGQDELYCASADWMPRNLEGRVELMFPVEDDLLKQRIKETLDTYLADNRQSFELRSDGSWIPVEAPDDQLPIQAQAVLYRRAVERSRQEAGNDKKEFRVRRKPPKV
jgi:polyphosphate kinase